MPRTHSYPTNLSYRIANDADYDLLATALESYHGKLLENGQDALAGSLYELIGSARIIGDSGLISNLPEARLLVQGKKVSEGTLLEMSEAFDREVGSHKAPVSLLKLTGASYRPHRHRGRPQ